MNYSLIVRFITVWIIENIFVESHPCEIDNTVGGLGINCDDKLTGNKLPKDLEGNAVTLDISNNGLCEFSRHDFSKFRLLTTLIMTNLRCVETLSDNTNVSKNISLEKETFDDLLLLEILDISNSPIVATADDRFRWPKNLKLLRLVDVHHVPWDFSELEKLETFIGMNCYQHEWPNFHPRAPLNFIDLRENKISYITVEQVANFCLLQVLLINIMLHEERIDPIMWRQAPYNDFRCTCLRLKSWVQKKDIYGLEYANCTFVSEDLIAKNPTLSTPCNGSFEIAEKIYQTCWHRNLEQTILFYLHIIVTVIATVLIVGGLYFFLKKSFGIYQGSRNEVIEDPNAPDDTLSDYEFDFESESEIRDLAIIPPARLTEPSTKSMKGAPKIVLLHAKNFIPQKAWTAWSSISFALRADTGLRLLPREKAQNILKEMRKVVDESSFVWLDIFFMVILSSVINFHQC